MGLEKAAEYGARSQRPKGDPQPKNGGLYARVVRPGAKQAAVT